MSSLTSIVQGLAFIGGVLSVITIMMDVKKAAKWLALATLLVFLAMGTFAVQLYIEHLSITST